VSFIGEVCPECEGNPDEIGGTGYSTCGNDRYIETKCTTCDGTGEILEER
jgi:DnaJ-class molecular chaperone